LISVALTLLAGGVPGQVTGQAEHAEGLARWADYLPTDPRVLEELKRFRAEEVSIEEWAPIFASTVRTEILASAGAQLSLFLSGECRPSTKVSIGNPEFSFPPGPAGSFAESDSWKKFRKSLIYTETVACFETAKEPGEVLQSYVGEAFRMRADSRITAMWTDEQGSCLETRGVFGLVDPTRMCNRTHEFLSDHVAAQHSQVVFNEGRQPYQNIYFKESLKTFVKMPGGVALHYINFTRAADLGRIKRWIGAGQIEDSQKTTVEEFQQWLLVRGPTPP
jgi:hypothetical protein